MVRRRWATLFLALIVALGLLPLSPASAARNRPPRIKKAVMKDVNNDGKADRVVLTYNERINHRVDKARFPFRVQGYRVLRVNKARRALKLVILVKPTAKAKAKPDFVKYARTRMQPVKDIKGLQAAKQLLTKNIIGLAVTPPPPPPPTEKHTLSVQTGGSGTGTVTSDPAGIDCGTVCQADYDPDTSVTLTATPAADASPEVAWTGCASNPTPTTCAVTMDQDKIVGATFAAAGSKTLSVSKEGNGSVSSTSTPTQATQISCSTTCASTTASYPDNSIVKLTATPGQAGMLITWGGACSGTGATCDVVMNAPKQVSVKFELPTLIVTRAGSGTVTSSPAGIDCGADCTGEFAKDAKVTLTAAAADGWKFTGWSQDATCADSATCEITMSASKNVTATFTEITGPIMRALNWSVTGGTLQCAADGAAPTDCQTSYVDGTTLVITAFPAVGSLPSPTWGGDCSSATLTICNLTMNADKTVTATFGTAVSTDTGTTTDGGTTDGGLITIPDTGGLLSR